MTQYASYDPETGLVTGFYDTDVIPQARYGANWPANLVEMTPDQWNVRTTTAWIIENGSTIWPNTPPVVPPTLQQQAQAMLNTGIEIASASAPSLSATYPVDSASCTKISGIVAAISGGLGLPSGGAEFNWLDTSGAPHAFTSAQFLAFAKAIMQFEYALSVIAGSGTGSLPAQPTQIG